MIHNGNDSFIRQFFFLAGFYENKPICRLNVPVLETDKSLFEIILRHRHDPEGISSQYTMLAVIRANRH